MLEDSSNDCTQARYEGSRLNGLSFIRRRRPANDPAAYDHATALPQGLAVGKTGWWKRQMLLDRSLRSMALLMTLFAVSMVIICAAYMPDFLHRGNVRSTSVGGSKGQSCDKMESINIVSNVALTLNRRYLDMSHP